MKRLFWNTVASSADTTILIVLSLVLTPVFITYFGPANYGVFVFLNIFSIYGALSFFDLGMEGALMTHVARYEAEDAYDKIRKALFISVLYYGVIGFIVAIGLYGAAEWLSARFDATEVRRAEVLTAIYLVALNSLLQFLTVPFIAVLQGLHRFTLTKVISALFNIVQYMILMAIAIWTRRIDLAFFGITALSALKLTTYSISCLRGTQSKIDAKLDITMFLILWKTSNVLFINRIIGLIYNQVGKILIWWKMPIVNMAVYDVVNRPASLIRVLVGMVYSAAIPEVSRLKHLNARENIKILYLRLIRYAYILITPIIVATSVHASRLLETWISPDFVQYAPMVQILMLASFISPMGAVASTVVVGLNKVKETQWISVLGTIVNVIIGVVLAGEMGIMGLLIGVLMAEVLMSIPYVFKMNQILVVKTTEVIKPLIRLIALAAGMAIIHSFLILQLDSIAEWVLGVGAITLLHYGLQVLLLLQSSERVFLLERIKK